MKRLLLIGETLAISVLASFAVHAGTWQSNAVGWWYDYGNGTYPASSWQWIDGNGDGVAECYYFNQYGYMVANTVQDGYLVNSDGQWVENGAVQMKYVGVTNTTVNQQVTITQNSTQSASLNNGGVNLLDVDPVQRSGAYHYTNWETTRNELWKEGIYMWGGTYITYLLDGKYSELSFKYAPAKNYGEYPSQFLCVYGDDDTILWESDEISYKDHTQSASVDISGQDEIRIYVRHENWYFSEILLKDLYVR